MSTQEFATAQDALAHYGVKGMRWGVRRETADSGTASSAKPPSRKEALSTVRSVGSSARTLISESKRASTKSERAAIAKRYEKEVLGEIKKPEFKQAYQKASTMGKGEMAAHAVCLGPAALITIPAMRSIHKKIGEAGYELEIDAAHDILREMRS